MISAKRLEVLCFITKNNFSLLLSSMKRLRRKIFPVLWQETVKLSMFMCNYKFDSSNKKQIRDFLRDRETGYLDFPRKQIKLSKINQKFGNGSNIRSMDARSAIKRLTYRTESSSTAIGSCFTTTKSRRCWNTSALDRIGSGNTATSINV